MACNRGKPLNLLSPDSVYKPGYFNQFKLNGAPVDAQLADSMTKLKFAPQTQQHSQPRLQKQRPFGATFSPSNYSPYQPTQPNNNGGVYSTHGSATIQLQPQPQPQPFNAPVLQPTVKKATIDDLLGLN